MGILRLDIGPETDATVYFNDGRDTIIYCVVGAVVIGFALGAGNSSGPIAKLSSTGQTHFICTPSLYDRELFARQDVTADWNLSRPAIITVAFPIS